MLSDGHLLSDHCGLGSGTIIASCLERSRDLPTVAYPVDVLSPNYATVSLLVGLRHMVDARRS